MKTNKWHVIVFLVTEYLLQFGVGCGSWNRNMKKLVLFKIKFVQNLNLFTWTYNDLKRFAPSLVRGSTIFI